MGNDKIIRVLCFLSLPMVLSSCSTFCSTCDPNWRGPETEQAILTTDGLEQSLPPEVQNLPHIQPAVVDFGSVMAVVNLIGSQRDYLGTLIADASQEIQNIVSEIQHSTQVVLNDLDGLLTDHLDRTYEELDQQEKKIFRHAVLLSDRISRATIALEKRAFDDAKILLFESNIVAYDAEYNLPCRDKVPRFVYTTSNPLVVWPDVGSATQSDVVRFRGNYLGAMSGNVLISGFPDGTELQLPVFNANQNEVSIKIDRALESKLLELTRSTELKITKPYQYCSQGDNQTLEASFTVNPVQRYQAYLEITPYADIPTRTVISRSYHRSTDGKCDREFSDSTTYPIAPPYELAGDPWYSQSNRCGSHVVDVYGVGRRTVKIDAYIKGCGYNWVFNCKGNGVVNASISIPVKKLDRHKLQYRQLNREATPNTRVVFPYGITFPGSMVGNPDCSYYLRVKDPNTGQQWEFRQDDPPTGIVPDHTADQSTCDVSVEFAPL